MKIKLGIYFKPDTLDMIQVTNFDNTLRLAVGAWIVVNHEYSYCAVSIKYIINNYKYLGEL